MAHCKRWLLALAVATLPLGGCVVGNQSNNGVLPRDPVDMPPSMRDSEPAAKPAQRSATRKSRARAQDDEGTRDTGQRGLNVPGQ